MIFSEAIAKVLNEGKRIRRPAWRGDVSVGRMGGDSKFLEVRGKSGYGSRWTPWGEDFVATDWIVVGEPAPVPAQVAERVAFDTVLQSAVNRGIEQQIQPCPRAVWNADERRWELPVKTVEDLLDVADHFEVVVADREELEAGDLHSLLILDEADSQ